MATEIRAPLFPESVSEGTLMAWHKQVGEAVLADEKLADIETDKIVLEVVAQAAGVLEKIAKAQGQTITSGELLGILGDPGVTPVTATPTPAAAAPQPKPAPAAAPVASPSARKMMKEHQVSPDTLQGSGRGGRISKADVIGHLDAQRKPAVAAAPLPAPAPAPTAPPPATVASPPPPRPPQLEGRVEERVPMTRIRARIAERLVQAQQTAAILTTFNEVNMKPVMDLRARYKTEFEEKHGVKLGFMSFFVKAAVEALKRYPVANASIDGGDIVYHGYYDIGIAVSAPRGLVVPVLRNADHLGFAEIESRVRDFGQRAQTNQLGLDELTGGTFTLSNGGVFGSMLSTPILNPPQSAILGMHNITERPVAENGQVVIRPVMYLALSYDHRIIDGREAILFLVTIKQMLEDPARLLLEI